MSQKPGYTTGTCAAAAALAAAKLCCDEITLEHAHLTLPNGESASIAIEFAERTANGARAGVRKAHNDDPDITRDALIICELSPIPATSAQHTFHAGSGVGRVTRPGLQLEVGEAAINPVPRAMITSAISSCTDQKFAITISVPGGDKLAEKTFNPRLGIVGGISIIGTSGTVRPFSTSAVRETINSALNVAAANFTENTERKVILVPGHYGYRRANELYGNTPYEIVEVSNEWGYAISLLKAKGFTAFYAIGHPGKMAKLPMGYTNTHSKKSPPALEYVQQLMLEHKLQAEPVETTTVEGLFAALDTQTSQALGNILCAEISAKMFDITALPCKVILINMKDETLGESEWRYQ